MKPSPWTVLTALWAVAFITQGVPNYGASVINTAMAAEWGLDRSTLGLGFTLFVLTQGGTAPLVAWLSRRCGILATLLLGACGMAAAAALLALVGNQPWHYLLLFGVLLGSACALAGGIPLQSCTAQWFEQGRGLAMAMVMTASSVGGFVAAPLLAAMMVAGGDWRIGWYAVAAAALFAAVIALLWVREPAAREHRQPGGAPLVKVRGVHRSEHDWSLRMALATPAMWLSVISAIAFNVVAFTLLAHLLPHLQGLGHPGAQAAMALGCMSLAGVVGKLGAGYACDRFEPRAVWSVALLMCAAGVLLFLDARGMAVAYLATFVVGLGGGASIVCWAALLANYYGARAFAGLMGLQMALMTPLAALSPFLAGLSFDHYGSYTPAFLAITALLVISAFALLLARPPRVPSDPATEVSQRWVH
ncbi:MFS transporter [Pseudomonas sp. NBRC 100443]|uniref:MFS transporter n=1 Tax=Pseudomonas sp. NBRC 100443 TaxID=1113665 RepID=UPI0024A2A79C|nr:MFS transporter [Pseudomonas sp. NBRC 100443]GLU37332.1 MFS transporter [Pseudomonas sp. NBRC 100443]